MARSPVDVRTVSPDDGDMVIDLSNTRNQMKTLLTVIAIATWLVAVATHAAAPANAPAGTTGLCNDGTYYSGPTKQGACRGHKGVKEWYGTLPAAPAGQASSNANASAPSANTAKPAATNTPPTAPSSAAPAKSDTAKGGTAAAGGGPGQVWVNLPSKVYHCPGTRWYGKTKQGEFMSEAEAKAKGFKPDHGKACS